MLEVKRGLKLTSAIVDIAALPLLPIQFASPFLLYLSVLYDFRALSPKQDSKITTPAQKAKPTDFKRIFHKEFPIHQITHSQRFKDQFNICVT